MDGHHAALPVGQLDHLAAFARQRDGATREREAAAILGIPYDAVMQAALIPVAYTVGASFKPAHRKPLDTMVHWDEW